MSTASRSRVFALALLTLAGATAWAQSAAPASPMAPVPAGGPTAQGLRHGGPGMHPGGPGHQGHQGHHGHRGGEQHHGALMGMGGGPLMMLLGRGQDRALELVKATPQQRADIRRIAGAARDDLRAARQEARPRRGAMLAAWTADRVDAAALEAERARMAARRDAAGKRMVQAMVDIGAVLQPEQRRLLAEHAARRGPHRRAELTDLDVEHAQAVVD